MKAQIKFRMPDGTDWYVNKTFNDRQHLDNYMSKVERDKDCFVDEVWYDESEAHPSEPSCEECNDKGWIDTYNTNTNVQEIQRCDECKVFTSDDKAKQFKNK